MFPNVQCSRTNSHDYHYHYAGLGPNVKGMTIVKCPGIVTEKVATQAEVDALKVQIRELLVERNKYLRYINNYGSYGGDCKSCGELTHSGYICFSCGRDGSYSDEEWNKNA